MVKYPLPLEYYSWNELSLEEQKIALKELQVCFQSIISAFILTKPLILGLPMSKIP